MKSITPTILQSGLDAALAFDATGITAKIVEMAAGDVSWNPTANDIQLMNEMERVPVLEGSKIGKPSVIGNVNFTSGYDWATTNHDFNIDVNESGIVNVPLTIATTDIPTTVTAITDALILAGITDVEAYSKGNYVGIQAVENGLDQRFELSTGTVDALATLGINAGIVYGSAQQIQIKAVFDGPDSYFIRELGWIMELPDTSKVFWALWSDDSPYAVPRYSANRIELNVATATIEVDQESFGSSLITDLQGAGYTLTATNVDTPNAEVWTLTDPNSVVLATDIITNALYSVADHFDLTINEAPLAKPWLLNEEIKIRSFPQKVVTYKAADSTVTLDYTIRFDTLPADSVSVDITVYNKDTTEIEVSQMYLMAAQQSIMLHNILLDKRLRKLENA